MFEASEWAKPFGSHNRAQTFGERVGTRVLRAHEIGAQTPSIGTLEVHWGNVTPQGCAQQFLRPGPHELRRVALDMDGYQPASAARLSAVVMNLITTAVAEHAGQAGSLPAESRENTLLMRIHAFIEQHLGDCDLAPGPVADAHYISVRYLYRLFEAQGTTVAAWIRHRRLERCRADLGDPALGGAPVSAVAARWGLPDSAHFNRLFKRTYGLPPAEYRRACLAPGS